MATDNPNSGEGASPAEGEVLKLSDVLSGGDSAGAALTFQTIGGSTIVNIDADGPGPATHIAVLTLANVAGKTLQDLLNDTVVGGY